MKEIKEVKDSFSFEMNDATYDTVKQSTAILVTAYESLKTFTTDDTKAAYTANDEDLLFVDAVIEKIPVIRSKNILVNGDIITGIMRKRKFVSQNRAIVTALRKLADKLEAGETIAMSEVYNFAVVIHDAVGNAVHQRVDGALDLYNAIDETKLRAARAAETRKKNEAAKKKAEKAALAATKSVIAVS